MLRRVRAADYSEAELTCALAVLCAEMLEFAVAALDAHPRRRIERDATTLRDAGSPRLTDNQRLILVLVAQGRTYKEIGSILGRSWRTINNSVEQIRAKFGAASRGELVAEAIRLGIMDLDESLEASWTA